MPRTMNFQHAMSFASDSGAYRGDEFVVHENASMLPIAF